MVGSQAFMKCCRIAAAMRDGGRRVGDKMGHDALNAYIGKQVGLDARTCEKFKRALVRFGYLKVSAFGFEIVSLAATSSQEDKKR